MKKGKENALFGGERYWEMAIKGRVAAKECLGVKNPGVRRRVRGDNRSEHILWLGAKG